MMASFGFDASNNSVPTAALGLAVAAVFSFLWASFWRKTVPSSPWPKVPGSLPLLGNLLSLGGPDNFTSRLEEWADTYGKESGAFEFTLLGNRYVVPTTPEGTAEVLSQRPYLVQRNSVMASAGKSIGGDGLFVAEGKEWGKSRRLMSPAFNRKNVGGYVGAIRTTSERLVRRWTGLASASAAEGRRGKEGLVRRPIAVNRDLVVFAMDITCLVTFGHDLNSLEGGDDNTGLGKDAQTLFEVLFVRTLSPVRYWNIPLVGQYLDGGAAPKGRVMRFLRDVVEEEHERRRRQRSSAEPGGSAAVGGTDEKGGGGGERQTFLSKMVEVEASEKVTSERLAGEIFTVLLAGTDTTSNTLSSCLFEVGRDAALQEELAEEAGRASLDGVDGAAAAMGLLTSLPRLRSLVFEVLRLRGPTPMLLFEATEEGGDKVTLSGAEVSGGTLIVVLSRYVSKIEEGGGGGWVPDGPDGEGASDFCARRWLVSNSDGGVSVKVPPVNKFLPFGHGMRRCPGADLAELEILMCLVHILKAFRLTLKDDHRAIKLVTRFTETFDGDVELIVTPREGTS